MTQYVVVKLIDADVVIHETDPNIDIKNVVFRGHTLYL